MRGKWRISLVSVLLASSALVLWLTAAQTPSHQAQRDDLMKTFSDGNWNDAYQGLKKLALDPKDDPLKVSADLTTAIPCLEKLGRWDEIDAFREGVIAAHKNNWRLLDTAAQTYTNVQHYGYIVAGKFYRADHRGGGRLVNAMHRDRLRRLP